MLPRTPDMIMTEAQHDRWETLLEEIRSLLSEETDDPWLLHGTGQDAARSILADGFDPSTSYISCGEPGSAVVKPCVFWTNSLDMALNFATKRAGFPVFLLARTSDVVASGEPVPDLFTWEINADSDEALKPADWRDSLARLKAIAVVDCRHVANLRLVTVEALDVRPDPDVYYAALKRLMGKGGHRHGSQPEKPSAEIAEDPVDAPMMLVG